MADEKTRHMHYWRKNFFESLKDVARDASSNPAWAEYATFCREYENGLRKTAFASLSRFISQLEYASFQERREFVSWLCSKVDGMDGRHMLIPHPLNIRLIEPTLLEWTIVEPDSSEPHRWLSGLDHLRQAIELNPTDEIARRKLILLTWGQLSFNALDLPSSYRGNFSEDLEFLDAAEALVPGLEHEGDRHLFATEIQQDRQRILDHIQRFRY